MDDTVTGRGEASAPARGRGATVALWVLQVLVALSFGSAAVQKLGGTDYMVNIFNEIGFGTWFRYAIGVIELIGALALLVPVLSGAAALGLALLMVGGTITNAAIGENVLFPLVFLLFTLPLVWGRRPRLAALVRRFRGAS